MDTEPQSRPVTLAESQTDAEFLAGLPEAKPARKHLTLPQWSLLVDMDESSLGQATLSVHDLRPAATLMQLGLAQFVWRRGIKITPLGKRQAKEGRVLLPA